MLRATLIAACVGASATLACTPSRPAKLPDGWVAQEAPTDSALWLDCANRALSEWTVAVGAAGDLRIALTSSETESFQRPEVGGFFEAENHGEFGGHVDWVDSATGARTRLLATNPIFFTPADTGVWLWSGLAHMATSTGDVVNLRRGPDGRWQSSVPRALPSTPEAVLPVSSDSALVVVSTGVLAVRPAHGTWRWLHQTSSWRYAHASSAARDDEGRLYLGLPHAVVRLSPRGYGYREEWLVPVHCRTLVLTTEFGPCECRAS